MKKRVAISLFFFLIICLVLTFRLDFFYTAATTTCEFNVSILLTDDTPMNITVISPVSMTYLTTQIYFNVSLRLFNVFSSEII